MSRSILIKSLLKVENIEDVNWCDYATEVDDLSYVILLNFVHSEEFIYKLETDIGKNISFDIPKQEYIMQLHLEKSNNGVEICYDFAKQYIRKLKLKSFNESDKI